MTWKTLVELLDEVYNVKNIIRIGSAGALSKDLNIKDIVLASSAYSDSNFRYALTKSKSKKISSSNSLNQTIINTSKELGINITKGTIYTSEIFDVYESISHLLDKVPKNTYIALFPNAKKIAHIIIIVNKKNTLFFISNFSPSIFHFKLYLCVKYLNI